MDVVRMPELANVNGGYQIAGTEQGSDGRSCFVMHNPPVGTQFFQNPSRPTPIQESIRKYNEWWDRVRGDGPDEARQGTRTLAPPTRPSILRRGVR